MNFFKKYYLVAVFLFALLGIGLIAHSNNYDVSTKTVEYSLNGQSKTEILHFIQPKFIYFNIAGQIALSFSIAIFISLFFIRYLDNQERTEFEKLMLKIQGETAKDAIESIFNRIIDKRFFKIIKDDLLSAKLIRKNATWKYDITENENGTLTFNRIITYKLHNISSTAASETLTPTASNNAHCSSKISKCVIEKGTEKKELDMNIEDAQGFTTGKKTITIEPEEHVGIVIIMEQLFSSGYVFETHFTRHPIINLDIIVNFPRDYSFSLEDSFSSKCRLKINEDGVKSYNVHGAIFKGQGIEFICEKKIANKSLERDA